MDDRRASSQQVFGRRAAYYVTSAAHTDPQVLERLVELARPQPVDRVLDIGTGTGHTALALAPHAAWVVGLDLTPEMLAEARLLQAERGIHNTRWLLGDAEHLPMGDGAFGVVACRRAAHHFGDMPAAMAEMARVLAPGGRLVVDDRTVPDDLALDAFMNRLDVLHDHSHVREYSPAEWAAFCQGVGLVVDAVEVYTRHRPLTSLTDGVDPADVAEILALVRGLSEAQAAALHLQQPDGGAGVETGSDPAAIRFDHHYLLVAAHRPG
jgi:SAM-dependent methyltransferase